MRLLVVVLFLVLGCASMNQLCIYDDEGELKTIRTRSTVVGTGETTLASTNCAAMVYSTRDTGFSEEAAPVLGAVTEGAMKGLVPLP